MNLTTAYRKTATKAVKYYIPTYVKVYRIGFENIDEIGSVSCNVQRKSHVSHFLQLLIMLSPTQAFESLRQQRFKILQTKFKRYRRERSY